MRPNLHTVPSCTLALVVCAGLSTPASASLSYTTQYQLQSDGSLLALSLPETQSYADFLSDAMGLYGYRVYNKRKLNEELLEQRKQELKNVFGDDDDASNFGELGDEVQFNPLATGGITDLPTPGDGFVDPSSPEFKIIMEFATVDPEKQVFKQEFGPVRVQRLAASDNSGGDPDANRYDFSFAALGAWDPTFFATDANGLTQTFDVTLTVVPAPSAAAALLGMGSLAAVRRRRN